MSTATLTAALTIAAAVTLGCEAADAGPDVGSRGEAEIVCETFVERHLRAPSTAEFRDATSEGDGPRYRVDGYVASENAFGGTVDNRYLCRVEADGDGEWTLLRMSGLTN